MDSEFLNTTDDIKTEKPTMLLNINKKIATSDEVRELETNKDNIINSNDIISNYNDKISNSNDTNNNKKKEKNKNKKQDSYKTLMNSMMKPKQDEDEKKQAYQKKIQNSTGGGQFKRGNLETI